MESPVRSGEKSTSNMKKALLLLATAFSCSLSFAGSFLLEGTYTGDTRYDVNKVFNGRDDLLCWAAAGSNVIKYWQNSYAQHGYDIPSGVPSGTPTDTYNSDIFQTFVDNWSNKGGYSENALSWWFDLTVPINDPQSSTVNPGSTAGGYWQDLPFTQEYWVFTQLPADEYFSTYGDLKLLLDAAIADDCPLTAAIYTESGGGHAITIWGYEYGDSPDTITGFWISDSDDGKTGNLLVDARWEEQDSMWYLSDYYDSNEWYLGSLTALTIPAPEPSSGVFMLGAVSCLSFRRRRN